MSLLAALMGHLNATNPGVYKSVDPATAQRTPINQTMPPSLGDYAGLRGQRMPFHTPLPPARLSPEDLANQQRIQAMIASGEITPSTGPRTTNR